jgi:hypothetical protein
MTIATTDTVAAVVRRGLRALTLLYPDGRYPDVYFVIGRLNSAGTVSARGMLMGAEMSSRTSTTPVDEIPAWVQQFTSSVSVATLGHIVIHETVHVLQFADDRTCCRNLLHDALVEGGADFLSELATGPWLDSMATIDTVGRTRKRSGTNSRQRCTTPPPRPGSPVDQIRTIMGRRT